jgi:large subunit ribosomal protein L13
MVKTSFQNKNTVEKEWFLIDASGKTVGRLCTRIASILRGKHKPNFTPHVDCGDNVIVINAEKVHFTGKKWDSKVYYKHTGYIGGLKTITAQKMLDKKPEAILRHAIWGMLPKTRLGRELFRNVKVYAGEEHPHHAQQPKPLTID